MNQTSELQQLIEMMKSLGWEQIDGQIIWSAAPDSRATFGSWLEAIIACIGLAGVAGMMAGSIGSARSLIILDEVRKGQDEIMRSGGLGS